MRGAVPRVGLRRRRARTAATVEVGLVSPLSAEGARTGAGALADAA